MNMDFANKLTELGYGDQANLLWEKMQEKELNSIIMKTEKSDESQFEIGESKIGGTPHLPKGFIWPEYNGKPLAFLAQITQIEQNLFPRNSDYYLLIKLALTRKMKLKTNGKS